LSQYAASATSAGAHYALLNNFVDLRALYWTQSGDFVIMAVLGGMRSSWGRWSGLRSSSCSKTICRGQTENWMFFVGLFFVPVVLFFPRGILGAVRRKVAS
jgi:branched-chain amino acid transport system permease protein